VSPRIKPENKNSADGTQKQKKKSLLLSNIIKYIDVQRKGRATYKN
jgi:hypothetical protein